MASRDNRAVAIHPPEIGQFAGRLGRGLTSDLAMVVSVRVVLVTELPGVIDAGANAAVVLGGSPDAENVITFGKPPVNGLT
jgi:hypothetical protein